MARPVEPELDPARTLALVKGVCELRARGATLDRALGLVEICALLGVPFYPPAHPPAANAERTRRLWHSTDFWLVLIFTATIGALLFALINDRRTSGPCSQRFELHPRTELVCQSPWEDCTPIGALLASGSKPPKRHQDASSPPPARGCAHRHPIASQAGGERAAIGQPIYEQLSTSARLWGDG